MEIIICLVAGYLVGTINPAALLSKLKKVNLRAQGTKNLGATNTMLTLGKGWGAFVMLFDIAKAFLISKIAAHLFPEFAVAGLLTGCAAVVGHIFPFYMGFKGGKGLAAFGGMVLAYNPRFFFVLLATGVLLMFISNYGVALPVSATVLFPFMTAFYDRNLAVIFIAGAASLLVLIMNLGNVGKASRNETVKVRDFVRGKEQQEDI